MDTLSLSLLLRKAHSPPHTHTHSTSLSRSLTPRNTISQPSLHVRRSLATAIPFVPMRLPCGGRLYLKHRSCFKTDRISDRRHNLSQHTSLEHVVFCCPGSEALHLVRSPSLRPRSLSVTTCPYLPSASPSSASQRSLRRCFPALVPPSLPPLALRVSLPLCSPLPLSPLTSPLLSLPACPSLCVCVCVFVCLCVSVCLCAHASSN